MPCPTHRLPFHPERYWGTLGTVGRDFLKGLYRSSSSKTFENSLLPNICSRHLTSQKQADITGPLTCWQTPPPCDHSNLQRSTPSPPLPHRLSEALPHRRPSWHHPPLSSCLNALPVPNTAGHRRTTCLPYSRKILSNP